MVINTGWVCIILLISRTQVVNDTQVYFVYGCCEWTWFI